MSIPFNKEEIRRAIKKRNDNKAPGPDNINTELLKNSPEEIFSKIADLFNSIAEQGILPKDLNLGYLISIKKSGKKKANPESLRPIILLNVIRKLLALVIIQRISSRIDSHIPITQSAYRKGRSTTENVFAFKVLSEKAVTEENSELNIRMIDMSKAFDNINRVELLKDLKKILRDDELHIIKILINEVQLQVKNKDI